MLIFFLHSWQILTFVYLTFLSRPFLWASKRIAVSWYQFSHCRTLPSDLSKGPTSIPNLWGIFKGCQYQEDFFAFIYSTNIKKWLVDVSICTWIIGCYIYDSRCKISKNDLSDIFHESSVRMREKLAKEKQKDKT